MNEQTTNSMCVSCETIFNKSGARCGTQCPVCRGTVREVLTGVIDNNSVPHIWDELGSGNEINLDYENALREHKLECGEDESCAERGHEDWNDEYESQSDTMLIGDWAKDSDGDYVPIVNGDKGYAAIVRESVSQVVWSRAIAKRKSMCSPCYPMQADLDSGDGTIPCYAFPADMMEEN